MLDLTKELDESKVKIENFQVKLIDKIAKLMERTTQYYT